MSSFWRMATGILTLALVAGAAAAAAGGPRYSILQVPSGTTPAGRVVNPGSATSVTAQPYAWGWFGATPQPQGVRHRGYYQDAWLWHW